MGLQVRVDRARCIGSKSCVHAAAGVFELDEMRISTVIDPDAEPVDAVVEAALNCPTSAISVSQDGRRLV